MKRILGWLGQLALLVVATFVFIVLYAHGPSNFVQGAGEEFRSLAGWISGENGEHFASPP